MFGDVGGLNDFFFAGLSVVFGAVSKHLMLASVLPKLFRYTKKDEPANSSTPNTLLSSMPRLGSISVLDSCFCLDCQSNQRKKRKFKAFSSGAEIFQNSFDIENLIRQGWALRTIKRLFLTT